LRAAFVIVVAMTLILTGCAAAPVAAWRHDLDDVVQEAVSDGRIPGAVIWVGRADRTLYSKAYGMRSLTPVREEMSLATTFDIASLTKVVATATAIMILAEEGQLALGDRVSEHIPEFSGDGKDVVTITHLLTHTSGLRPSLQGGPEWRGSREAIRLAAAEKLQAAPGQIFIYSDIGFILLGEIVARVSGEAFDDYVRARILQPLSMEGSAFNPDLREAPETAPTQSCASQGDVCEGITTGGVLRGVVHDPTARRMGGVAGHAGLFAPASDLSRFARMMLRGGELDGRRVLSRSSVALMTAPATSPGMSVKRGLGWDIDSPYSSVRGEYFPVGSFGHTGFTGTSLWIDPVSQTYVLLLTNRVHPDGNGDVRSLRSRVATIVAAGLGPEGAARRPRSGDDGDAGSGAVRTRPRAGVS